MEEKKANSKISERISEFLSSVRNNILPIKNDDSSLKRIGKNVLFTSFILLMSVVTMVLLVVISAVL